MGCGASAMISPEIQTSKLQKEKALEALNHGTLWRRNWLEFCDCLEQAQLAASHWALDEQNVHFVDCFKTLGIQSTEVFIVSKPFIAALEEHLSLLTDILALHRDIHANMKELTKARNYLQLQLKRSGLSTSSKSNVVVPTNSKTGDTTGESTEDILATQTQVQLRSVVIGYSQRREDPLYEAKIRVEELTQMIEAKRNRCLWIKRERVPVSIFNLLKCMSEKWNRIADLFKSMCGILEHFSDEALRLIPDTRQSTPSLSGHSPERHNSSLLELSLIIKQNETSLKRRMQHMKKWVTFQSDCSMLWTQARESHLKHVQAIVEWWSPTPLLGQIHAAQRSISLSRTRTKEKSEIAPSPHLLSLHIWLDGISPCSTIPPTSDQASQISPTHDLVAKTFDDFLPTLRQLEYNEGALQGYYAEIEQIGRDAAMNNMVYNKQIPRSGASELSGKVVTLGFIKLEIARGKLEKLKAENEHFRIKTLIKGEFELWSSLSDTALSLKDGYESLSGRIPVGSNVTNVSLWAPVANVIPQQPLTAEKDVINKSATFGDLPSDEPANKTTTELLSAPEEETSPPNSMQDTSRASQISHRSHHLQEKSVLRFSAAVRSVTSGSDCHGLPNSASIPTIFSSRMSVDVPRFFVEKPLEDIVSIRDAAKVEPKDAISPLLPSRLPRIGSGGSMELGSNKSLGPLRIASPVQPDSILQESSQRSTPSTSFANLPSVGASRNSLRSSASIR